MIYITLNMFMYKNIYRIDIHYMFTIYLYTYNNDDDDTFFYHLKCDKNYICYFIFSVYIYVHRHTHTHMVY